MSYELIISEKPQAAEKIAKALSDIPVKKIRENNVNSYQGSINNTKIIVASAVGHLYTLGEKGGESWKYPVFETEWKPIYKINKKANYTKDYIKNLEKLGKSAENITIATDYDIEGEVIGLNLVRFALKKDDAFRMKFSTLTKQELIKAYQNKQKTLDWGQAKAGETRHTLDWYYGINLSRSLTQSIKVGAGKFKVLSTGRVQGPTLHFLSKKERIIQKFEPQDYFTLTYQGKKDNILVVAKYIEEKIFDIEIAKKIEDETINKNGIVKKIKSKRFKQETPKPFDLTSLQIEASNQFGYSPKRTLEIAQKLYIEGVASYPRTSSQKLPKELDLQTILNKLKKIPIYKTLAENIQIENPLLKPNEGKKTDPAHPAIHPTGEISKKLEQIEQKVYDLIVKRFLSCFSKSAIRETNTIIIDVSGYEFILKGSKTIEKNWHNYYFPYVKFEEIELVKLKQGEIIEYEKILNEKKQTTPTKRYTDASIIKELEKRNIGTKATRADILQNLRNRGYIINRSIKVTELGLKMDEIISKEIPDLVDEKLTRVFEEEMELIRKEKSTPKKVLDIAKRKLEIILKYIKGHEKELGKKLDEAQIESKDELSKVSKCPNCEKGYLVIKQSKKFKKKFVGCSNYPECKTIFNLPNVKIIKPIDTITENDGELIYILAGNTQGKIQRICINPKIEKEEEKKYEQEGMKCPNCENGIMILRKSYYGEFLGCSNYPNCKTLMNIRKGKVDTKAIDLTKKKKKEKKKIN